MAKNGRIFWIRNIHSDCSWFVIRRSSIRKASAGPTRGDHNLSSSLESYLCSSKHRYRVLKDDLARELRCCNFRYIPDWIAKPLFARKDDNDCETDLTLVGFSGRWRDHMGKTIRLHSPHFLFSSAMAMDGLGNPVDCWIPISCSIDACSP